jgi:hypothetical protein
VITVNFILCCANISQIRDDQTSTIKTLFKRGKEVQARSAPAFARKAAPHVPLFVQMLFRSNARTEMLAIEKARTAARLQRRPQILRTTSIEAEPPVSRHCAAACGFTRGSDDFFE